MISLLSMLAACGTAPSDHAEPHDHDHAGHHDPATPNTLATSSPHEAVVGSNTFRLHASVDQLRLEVLNSEGTAVQATGEARVVLTGTGEEAQRVVLQPEGTAWSGAARAEGASGYLAVVSVELEAPAVARITWGTAPEAAAHPHGPGEEHEHGADQGHDHGDGHTHTH